MPHPTIEELILEDEAATNKEQALAAERQQAVERRKENLAYFKQQESDVETALAAYGDAFKELKDRWKEAEKALSKRESVPHRKELAEEVAESEGPTRDEIKRKEEQILELTKAKGAAAEEAKEAEDRLQAVQAEFDKLKRKQADLDDSLKDIEELVQQVESRVAEQKTPDAATLFLLNELEAALDKARVISMKELKEQVLEAFPQLMTAKQEAGEKTALSEALQAKLEQATSERDELEAGRRASVVEELQAESTTAAGA